MITTKQIHHRQRQQQLQQQSCVPRFLVGRRVGILLLAVGATFCLFNVYRSATLSDQITGAHEYHQRESDVARQAALLAKKNYFRDGGPASTSSAAGKTGKPPEVVDRFSQIRSVHAEQFSSYNVTAPDGKVRTVPLWQRRLFRRNYSLAMDEDKDDLIGSYYFLTELLQVRIYASDKAKWTMAELKQWLHYMFLAGVEHVYVCDHFSDPAERLDRNPGFRRYVDAGLVSYQPWSMTGKDPITAQTRCYQRLIDRFKRRHLWQIAVDIDEYPFSPNDTTENFLVRYLDRMPDDVSEVLMPNYLMLGRGDRLSSRTVIERIVRMTPKPANDLVKPIYRPHRVRGANVHHNRLESGNRRVPLPDELRMLHYWGGRGQNWGPDTPKILAETIPMTSMRDAWSDQLENSLLVFGEFDAFSNETGP